MAHHKNRRKNTEVHKNPATRDLRRTKRPFKTKQKTAAQPRTSSTPMAGLGKTAATTRAILTNHGRAADVRHPDDVIATAELELATAELSEKISFKLTVRLCQQVGQNYENNEKKHKRTNTHMPPRIFAPWFLSWTRPCGGSSRCASARV